MHKKTKYFASDVRTEFYSFILFLLVHGYVTYLLQFLFEVVGAVTILHQQHDLLLVLRVVVQLNHILMLHLGLHYTFLSGISHLRFIHQFVFLNTLLYYWL